MREKLIAIVVAIALAGIGFWYWQQRQAAETTPTPVPTAAVPQPAPVTGTAAPQSLPVIREETAPAPVAAQATAPAPESRPDQPPLVQAPPQLEDSDAVVQDAVTQMSTELTQWLLPQEQVRKWVMLVNQMADGKIPGKDRPLEYPLPPFQVVKKNDTLWLDHGNYHRADLLIKSIIQIPPELLARYYHAWQPLLQKAQDELGNGARFHDRLLQAIARIEKVRPLQGDVKLEQGVLTYRFADPGLQQASAVEKQLWRLGPVNSLRIQQYLRKLKPLL